MAYDQQFAQRVRTEIGSYPGMSEKKMFGGIAYLLNGNMAVGVLGSDLIVRFDPNRQTEMAEKPYTHPFDMTGWPMKGWIMVSAEGCKQLQDLKQWVELGLKYAGSLPEK